MSLSAIGSILESVLGSVLESVLRAGLGAYSQAGCKQGGSVPSRAIRSVE